MMYLHKLALCIGVLALSSSSCQKETFKGENKNPEPEVPAANTGDLEKVDPTGAPSDPGDLPPGTLSDDGDKGVDLPSAQTSTGTDTTSNNGDESADGLAEKEGRLGLPGDDPTKRPGKGGDTPLMLDINRDGRIALTRETVAFDIDGDGGPDRLQWVDGQDGFLAIDLNGSGEIEGGRELFGSASFGMRFENGFSALSELDSNLDGEINALDLAFAELLVWQDRNRNGKSERSEIRRLNGTGITALSLSYVNLQPKFHHQSQVKSYLGQEATFMWADGYRGRLVDAYFHVIERSQAQIAAVHPLITFK